MKHALEEQRCQEDTVQFHTKTRRRVIPTVLILDGPLFRRNGINQRVNQVLETIGMASARITVLYDSDLDKEAKLTSLRDDSKILYTRIVNRPNVLLLSISTEGDVYGIFPSKEIPEERILTPMIHIPSVQSLGRPAIFFSSKGPLFQPFCVSIPILIEVGVGIKHGDFLFSGLTGEGEYVEVLFTIPDRNNMYINPSTLTNIIEPYRPDLRGFVVDGACVANSLDMLGFSLKQFQQVRFYYPSRLIALQLSPPDEY